MELSTKLKTLVCVLASCVALYKPVNDSLTKWERKVNYSDSVARRADAELCSLERIYVSGKITRAEYAITAEIIGKELDERVSDGELVGVSVKDASEKAGKIWTMWKDDEDRDFTKHTIEIKLP